MEGARDPESPGPGGPGETVAPAPGGEGLGRPGEDASPGSVGRRQRPPRPPIDLALDANQDGILSADEIANAPGALKTLDKNGDGRLTRDECLPPRPSNPVGEPALK
ncbi:MAG: hypothetical protein KA419_02695 [Acidobacteria bacterium]|nr:hypothetical protein [Acidobacteriota bacterium]